MQKRVGKSGRGWSKRGGEKKKEEGKKNLAGWILIIFAFVNLGLFGAGAITTRAGWFGD